MVSFIAGMLDADDNIRAASVNRDELVNIVNDSLDAFRQQRDDVNNFLNGGQTQERSEQYSASAVDEGQEIGVDEVPYEGHGRNLWGVAYTWRRYGWRFSYNSERWEYIDLGTLSEELEGKMVGNARRHTREMMVTAFENRTYLARDEFGQLTIKPGANGDPQPYFDVDGAEFTDSFYGISGVVAADISVTDNPLKIPVAKFDRHLGEGTTVVVINPADVANYTEGLDNLETRDVPGINRGQGERSANELTGVTVPGTFVGVDADSGAYLYKWAMVPQGYQLARRLETAPPLIRRVPAADALVGFFLEASEVSDPFWSQILRERFGYNYRNRLGLHITQLKASGNYEIPAAYLRPRTLPS